MKLLARVGTVVLLALGVSTSALAKDCKEPWIEAPNWLYWSNCDSKFTYDAGSTDVGGSPTDILVSRWGRLSWRVAGESDVKIEIKEFKNASTNTTDCPGTFSVNGTPVAKACEFTVLESGGRARIKLSVDDAHRFGGRYKFTVVLTKASQPPRLIDPQIEIDTDHGFDLGFLTEIAGGLLLVVAAGYAFYRWFARRSARR
jgi:hypothetical protein